MMTSGEIFSYCMHLVLSAKQHGGNEDQPEVLAKIMRQEFTELRGAEADDTDWLVEAKRLIGAGEIAYKWLKERGVAYYA